MAIRPTTARWSPFISTQLFVGELDPKKTRAPMTTKVILGPDSLIMLRK